MLPRQQLGGLTDSASLDQGDAERGQASRTNRVREPAHGVGLGIDQRASFHHAKARNWACNANAGRDPCRVAHSIARLHTRAASS